MSLESRIQIGDTLSSRYLIKSQLGSGGMGTVYLADDLKIAGKQWAVKETLRYSRQPSGFEAEAAVLGRLDHPFLPKMVDFLPPNSAGLSYLVMDYVRGETLQEKFECLKPFPWKKAVKYASQICDLFDYLHRLQPKPIIYRDLKPANLMIDEQDNVRLIDFGIARTHSQGQAADTLQLGTVGFAAPEQFSGIQSDARTDLYTLGALMFYLLSGGNFHTAGKPPAMPTAPELPPRLESVIGKLLRKDPEERYQSAAEAKTALESMLFPSVETNPDRDADLSAPAHAHLPTNRKLVLVGSVYKGAGATFTAAGLAKILSRMNIPNTLVECPDLEPQLYDLLNGESSAPFGYRFVFDDLPEGVATEPEAWTDGYTRWVPANPQGSRTEWKMEHWYELLYLLQSQVVIVDVGALWNHSHILELCGRADDLIAVFGPDPAKLNSRAAQENVVRLTRLQEKGLNVHWVANRDCEFAGRKEWLASWPEKRSVRIPEVPLPEVLGGLWKKGGLVDFSDTNSGWQTAFIPLAESIGARHAAKKSGRSTNGIFGFRRNKPGMSRKIKD